MKTKLILLTVLISFNNLISNAQSNEKLISAFKKSYELEAKGDFKQAADLLKKHYDKDSYEINLRLGWLTYNAGLFEESAAYYKKALDLKPYSEEAKFGLVYPKAALGKWQEVIRIYNDILSIHPNNTVANYRLGLIYFGQKNYKKAKTYFEKVVNLYPFDYDSNIMLAWTYFYLKDTKNAKILFQKTLLIRPDDASAKQGLKLLKN